MKSNAILKSFGLLALLGLLTAGSAQAGMGPCMSGMPKPAPSPACATDQGSDQACPLHGDSVRRGDGCGADRDELMRSVGKVAAGGIGIANQVMRVLLEEANRFAGLGRDM